MEFKKFSAGTKSYGTGKTPTEKQEANVCFHDDDLKSDLEDDGALRRVVMFLATCHTIIVDEKKGTYNSASPDELALVNAAKQFGYEFKERDEFDNIVVINRNTGEEFKYKLLNVCEFTSTRKRMSCIYRDPQDRIVLMCKGADAIVKDRLSQDSLSSDVFLKTQAYVDEYANEGLRTLFLAEKYIDEGTYSEWLKESNIAKLEINDREEKVAAVDEKIEVKLELIGSTAIEDRLQDQVADTIQFMKKTGIKVWVLTGDKIETAINIGVSAGLLDQNMIQHLIDDDTSPDLMGNLRRINQKIIRHQGTK